MTETTTPQAPAGLDFEIPELTPEEIAAQEAYRAQKLAEQQDHSGFVRQHPYVFAALLFATLLAIPFVIGLL